VKGERGDNGGKGKGGGKGKKKEMDAA